MENKKLLSLKEIQEVYGIGVPMLNKLLSLKKLEHVKVGNKNFIKTSVIEEYIDNNTYKAKS